MSHKWVLDNCKHSLKHYISLEKVIPAMVEKKLLLDKKIGKKLVKKNDKALFVDLLDQLTLEQFGEFLTVIRSIEEQSKERQLMKIFSNSMENMKLEEGSNVQKIVSDFIRAADADVSSQLPPTSLIDSSGSIDQSTGTVISGVAAAVLERKYPYPSGFLSGCKSQSFTREGGMLYSPEHGVTVIIPEGAVPASIEKFMLGVFVYIKGPFSIPENTQLCSPIVWFHHQPRFRFEADVTVKIPHCAIVAVQPKSCNASASLIEDDSVSVVTVQEGMDEDATQYALTRHLPADFSDGYHAVFAVRHFSPHTVVKCQNQHQSLVRKRLGSNESSGIKKRTYSNSSTVASNLPCKGQTTTKDLQKSGSLEDDLYLVKQGESRKGGGINAQGEVKFCVARCMPVDRSTGNWEVNFLISHWHPTGIQVSLTP